jgi:hypothetical protein
MLDPSHLEMARYEIKFVAQQSGFFRFKNWLLLNPCGISSQYVPRIVNNIYFDNFDCDSYWENLTGCTSRSKIRLRWYGGSRHIQQATLEFKSKRNRLGFKQSKKIIFKQSLMDMSYRDIVETISSQLDGDSALRFSLSNVPILANQYYREYFRGHDAVVRVTVDRDIKFFDQRDKSRINLLHQSLAPEISIMEVKTPSTEIERAEKILERIELAPSKSSKYVIGVQSLLGYQ